MRPARFVLFVVGVALILSLVTILVLSAMAGSSGAPMFDGGAGAGKVFVIVLLAVLIIRAGLLWADNRRQKK